MGLFVVCFDVFGVVVVLFWLFDLVKIGVGGWLVGWLSWVWG